MTSPTHPFDDLNWGAILSRLVAALLLAQAVRGR
jgi:hypothetical protein